MKYSTIQMCYPCVIRCEMVTFIQLKTLCEVKINLLHNEKQLLSIIYLNVIMN